MSFYFYNYILLFFPKNLFGHRNAASLPPSSQTSAWKSRGSLIQHHAPSPSLPPSLPPLPPSLSLSSRAPIANPEPVTKAPSLRLHLRTGSAGAESHLGIHSAFRTRLRASQIYGHLQSNRQRSVFSGSRPASCGHFAAPERPAQLQIYLF